MEYYTIRNCSIKRCPYEWSNLLATDDPGTRECLVCDRMVHLASDISELQRLAKQGECVAMEIGPCTVVGIPRCEGGDLPPEHADLELQASLRRYKAATHSDADLRTFFLRYLEGGLRPVAMSFYKQFVESGNKPDHVMVLAANRHGISLDLST